MAFKFQIFIITIILSICIKNSLSIPGVCTLDDMKLLAAEACEHLFQNDVEHSIRKREITNEIPEFENETELTPTEDRRHHHGIVRIHRKDYPRGGYLLVSNHHAKVLSKQQHDPQYRILPLKAHHRRMIEEMEEHNEHGIRDKRENNGGYVNVPYCCINKCRMDHFCRR